MSVRFRFKRVSIRFYAHTTPSPPRQQLSEALLHHATALLDQKLEPELHQGSTKQHAAAKKAIFPEQTEADSKRPTLAFSETRKHTRQFFTVKVLHEMNDKGCENKRAD